MIQGVEHLCHEESLKLLELFSLEKRRLWGELLRPFSTYRGLTRKMGTGF